VPITSSGHVLARLSPPLFDAHQQYRAIGAVISVLYLALTTAFNALLSCVVILAYFAFAIPIIYLLCRGRQFDRLGTFQLEKAEWFVNIGALAFMSFLAIFFCLRVNHPATKTNMNNSSRSTYDLKVQC
jgi:choline transport protein